MIETLPKDIEADLVELTATEFALKYLNRHTFQGATFVGDVVVPFPRLSSTSTDMIAAMERAITEDETTGETQTLTTTERYAELGRLAESVGEVLCPDNPRSADGA